MVLDTNVVVGHYLSRSGDSSNARVFRLWRDRRVLQIVVCPDIVAEYLGVLSRLRIPDRRVRRFEDRLRRRDTAMHVHLGARFVVSRDPDDNVFLAAAAAGRAKYLITNDRDLLDIPREGHREFRFETLTPQDFLGRL